MRAQQLMNESKLTHPLVLLIASSRWDIAHIRHVVRLRYIRPSKSSDELEARSNAVARQKWVLCRNLVVRKAEASTSFGVRFKLRDVSLIVTNNVQ